jgi:hypothetical protein
MKTIYADFNAMTETGQVCLSTRGSQKEIDEQGVQVGDRVWLSDGELVVGAEMVIDPRYGIVGVPDWDTMINLDDADKVDPLNLESPALKIPGPKAEAIIEEERADRI